MKEVYRIAKSLKMKAGWNYIKSSNSLDTELIAVTDIHHHYSQIKIKNNQDYQN